MKVHLTTLGCPKNQVDSELMLGMLTEAGFPLAERAEDAECVIVNTCAFIDHARQESVDTILELAKLKERGSCRALIVTGCLTQRYGGDILKELPRSTASSAPRTSPGSSSWSGRPRAATPGRPRPRRATPATRRRRGPRRGPRPTPTRIS